MWTWAQLGLHGKPCGLLDTGGFYASLVGFLDHLVATGFVRPDHRAMLVSAATPDALLAAFEAYQAPKSRSGSGPPRPDAGRAADRPGAVVRPLAAADVPAMHALLTANRAHLDRWLRWSSAVRTPADVAALIARFQAQLAGATASTAPSSRTGSWPAGSSAGTSIARTATPRSAIGWGRATRVGGSRPPRRAGRSHVCSRSRGCTASRCSAGCPTPRAARSPRGWVFERKGSAGSLTGSPTDSSITSCTGCSTASGDSGATSLPGNGHE